jgi:hypothetical protein
MIADHLAEIGGLREDVTVQTAAGSPTTSSVGSPDAWKRLLLPNPRR